MKLQSLNETQKRMIACSLEIDGRVDIAAGSVVGGHVSEFTYANGNNPVSAKAIELEELKAELEATIKSAGLEETIKNLRNFEDMPNLNLEGIEEFSSVPQMKAAVRNSGSHWFDKNTMRFFNSKIETGILQKRFFISSERQEITDPKRYTIRYFVRDNNATPALDCHTVGEFEQFETLADAKDYLKEYLKQAR